MSSTSTSLGIYFQKNWVETWALWTTENFEHKFSIENPTLRRSINMDIKKRKHIFSEKKVQGQWGFICKLCEDQLMQKIASRLSQKRLLQCNYRKRYSELKRHNSSISLKNAGKLVML
ncbi:hypothetical protein X975_18620, partial [Stegodyphus mimosarum]